MSRSRNWRYSSLVVLAYGFFVAVMAGWMPALRGADCDQNGVPDEDEIAEGLRADCNQNGLLDICEVVPLEMGLRGDEQEIATGPIEAIAGDFDGDGITDLAVGHEISRESAQISIVFGSEAGLVEPPIEYGAGTELSSLRSGDLDGDGDLDLVTASFDQVLLFLNDGVGTFGAAVSIPVPEFTRFVAPVDVSGDAQPDLVATNTDLDAVLVLENQGDGTFGDPVTVAAGNVGRRPRVFSPLDVEGDGDIDLAIIHTRSDHLFILRNNGDGTFTEAGKYETATGLRSVLAGDLNQDGHVDLLAHHPSGFTVYENEGDGTFAAPVRHLFSNAFVAIGDMDGDTDLDLSIANASRNSVSVLLNSDGAFTPVPSFPLPAPASLLVVGRFDANRQRDVAVIDTNPSVLRVLFGGERGQVDVETFSAPAGRPHSMTTADFNDDGQPDVAGPNGFWRNVSVLLGRGDGSVDPLELYPVSAADHVLSITSADLNGDGSVDLAMADPFTERIHLLWNAGDGSFDTGPSFRAGRGAIMVKTADLNGDGAPDLVSANNASDSVTVLLNQGDGLFGDRQDIGLRGSPSAVVAADFDGDGAIDLATANTFGLEIAVIPNQGSGTFGASVTYPTLEAPVDLEAVDLDLDGDTDIAVAMSSEAASVSLYFNNGNGVFGAPIRLGVDLVPYSLLAADLNVDGFVDLITTQNSGSVSIFLGHGDGNFDSPQSFEIGGSLRFSVAADFDDDGDLDLASSDWSGTVKFLLMNFSTPGSASEDYLERICTELDFHKVSVALPGSIGDRETKYLAPASADAGLLPTLFQNTSRFPLHQDFLVAAFPDRFPALTAEEYNRLVGQRATRLYYVGVITRFPREGESDYGFSILVDGSNPAEHPTLEETRSVYETLKDAFEPETLGFLPQGARQREIAEGWSEPGFPVLLEESRPPDTNYTAYTQGVGFGRVRILDAQEFAELNDSGSISFQDILVLDHAPRDIEGVLSGVITAEPQGELSHVAIRTARRGTPNAFVKDALEAFGPLEGELVRLEVRQAGYAVEVATQDAAEKWWAANRPSLSVIPTADFEFSDFSSLAEISDMDLDGLPVEARFGGKASNLARLQRFLDGQWEEYREKGFAIPVRYYLEFLEANTLFTEDFRRVTYLEYLTEIQSNERFLTDPQYRFATLQSLRAQMRDAGVVDPDLIRALASRVEEVFGTPPEDRVRYRSSSNVEDALEFNGAGLYTSTSGCSADDLDDDDVGPSICDPTRDNERGITRALKRVWSSLWNFGAYEERAFFGIPQELAAMGILVNRTFTDEAANGVAFTGNPSNPEDRRYVITVQLGEESVVSPEPGVRAEKNILEVVDGQVVTIVRAVPSSLVPPDTAVLTDAQLEELGALMAHIDQNFDIELGEYERDEVLLDLEFKFMPDGELAVKQVRPFLVTPPSQPSPTFELQIPTGTVACGVFGLAGANRGPLEEYQLKSVLSFREGVFPLPTKADTFELTVVEEVLFGPEREVLVADAPGIWRVRRLPESGGVTSYRFTYTQTFALPDGGSFVVDLSTPIELRGKDAEPLDTRATIDEEFLTAFPGKEVLGASIDGVPLVQFSSCAFESVPLWEIAATFDDGAALHLRERFLPVPPNGPTPTGPASLVRGEIDFGGTRHVVTDYWQLVYSAFRHNTFVSYWVVLDQAVTLPGVEGNVKAVEFQPPQPPQVPDARAAYLDENFEVLKTLAVPSHTKTEFGTEPRFRRGDVNADGMAEVTDAIVLLQYLFLDAQPPCLKSLDVNDDGRLNITDPIRLVLHLFQGVGPLPAPATFCGNDPTDDDLSCEAFAACDG